MAKEHLELEDVLQYLPYHLKWYNTGNDEDYGKILTMTNLSKGCKISLSTTLNTFTIQNFDVIGFEFKPILRPLICNEDIDNYFKPLFDKGDKEVRQWLDADYLEECGIDIDDIPYLLPSRLPKGLFDLLVRHHFDIFQLIPEKLALPIN